MIKVIEDKIVDTDAILNNWINEETKNSNTVLELGAGFFDRLGKVNSNVKKRIGIEIWQPYIDNAKYHNCIKINGSVFDYTSLVDREDFDTAMIIDVLEHFDESDGIKLIESLKNDFNKIILMIPEGDHPQDKDVTGYGAHEYQKHRSTWFAKDVLDKLKFDQVTLFKNFHSQVGKDTGCVFAVWYKK